MPRSILKSPPIVSYDDPTAMSTSGTLSTRPKSSVSFNRRTRVYLVPTRAELSPEEWGATFLSKADLTQIRDRIALDIKAMRDNNCSDDSSRCDEGPCYRGIEYMQSTKSIRQRQDHKVYVTSAILAAQKKGADSNHIAVISNQGSRWAVDSALIKAAADAAFVRRTTQNKAQAQQPTSSATCATNGGDTSLFRRQKLDNTLSDALYAHASKNSPKVEIRRSNSFPTLELGCPGWVVAGIPSAAITAHAAALDLAIS